MIFEVPPAFSVAVSAAAMALIAFFLSTRFFGWFLRRNRPTPPTISKLPMARPAFTVPDDAPLVDSRRKVEYLFWNSLKDAPGVSPYEKGAIIKLSLHNGAQFRIPASLALEQPEYDFKLLRARYEDDPIVMLLLDELDGRDED